MATVAELPGEWRRQAQDLENMAFAAARGASRDAVILGQCADELEAALAADADHRDALRFRKLAAHDQQSIDHDYEMGAPWCTCPNAWSERICADTLADLVDSLPEPQTTEGGA